ncbi:MAG TPA: hypothetical protein VKV22_11755 [Rhodanobacteraceae bacterium]|nr:hypothetical protein [Rhodanobacteraceae bacterium]
MSPWIDTRQSLPTEHEYVRFLVVGHSRYLMGVYENHHFRSRWGAYDEAQVKIWRKMGDAPHEPAPLRTSPEQHSGAVDARG